MHGLGTMGMSAMRVMDVAIIVMRARLTSGGAGTEPDDTGWAVVPPTGIAGRLGRSWGAVVAATGGAPPPPCGAVPTLGATWSP